MHTNKLKIDVKKINTISGVLFTPNEIKNNNNKTIKFSNLI